VSVLSKHLTGSAAAAAMCVFLAAGSASPAAAQDYFGKNQVQYQHFKWKVLETEHYLVHYFPEEEQAATDGARMAERAYARLSRIMQHEFREKKPIVFYSSRATFGENNVTGDLGEGVGGVTEPLRHRILLPFTGDYASFEQVLTHEMVHEFQYDIFARGKAGNGLQALAQINPPLWLAEGMAEYLSIGPYHPFTSTWIRDATLNGNLPSIKQMTEQPDRFFPYRFGEALWAYIGQRWGDEVIGNIMNAVPNVGVERAFRRELGLSLEDLSDQWREAMQAQHLPQIAKLDRARKFSQPLLTERKSGGEVFVAPALSNDGKYIAFISNGNFYRGQVFLDLWLGDARTGKRIKRLVRSTLNPNAEELQLIYSQSAFSPDGKYLAYTALRQGREVVYILDVERRHEVRRIDFPFEGVTGPNWSPDGKRLVVSGESGGISDLYIVNVDGSALQRLTDDRATQVQPQWSPDGKTIAFATDLGPRTNYDILRFGGWQIALYHLDDARIEILPNQAGLNLNPNWSPDGRSLAYISDRTGIENIFLYDLDAQRQFQLTNVVGGVLGFTQYSPALTWARGADRMAFVYYENGGNTVWAMDNPRNLKKEPFSETAPSVATVTRRAETADSAVVAKTASTATAAAADTATPGTSSFYRAPVGIRPSSQAPAGTERAASRGTITVAALLDSANMALPDTTKFRRYDYKIRFSPDYVARPAIGYAQNNFGNGLFGGTTIFLSDMLSDHQLAISAQINGSVSEGLYFLGYTNLSHRLQFTSGLYQQPYYYAQGEYLSQDQQGNTLDQLLLQRNIERSAFLTGIYPLNRFTRFEGGLSFTNLDRAQLLLTDTYAPQGLVDETQDVQSFKGVNFVSPMLALVSDNTLFGYTGPISGRRFRLQVKPAVGNWSWMNYLVDYRRYDPILFNFLTVATRGMAFVSTGNQADSLWQYLGYPDMVRGYDRATFPINVSDCPNLATSASLRCSPLHGSRFALASAELRFPLLRKADIGGVFALPPIEGLVFYDAATTWFGGQTVHFQEKATGYDAQRDRYLLTSHGLGVRVNLFNFAILRWDYVWPHDAPDKHPFWQFWIGPSF
jgi:Tol biopolymer transport system component